MNSALSSDEQQYLVDRLCDTLRGDNNGSISSSPKQQQQNITTTTTTKSPSPSSQQKPSIVLPLPLPLSLSLSESISTRTSTTNSSSYSPHSSPSSSPSPSPIPANSGGSSGGSVSERQRRYNNNFGAIGDPSTFHPQNRRLSSPPVPHPLPLSARLSNSSSSSGGGNSTNSTTVQTTGTFTPPLMHSPTTLSPTLSPFLLSSPPTTASAVRGRSLTDTPIIPTFPAHWIAQSQQQQQQQQQQRFSPPSSPHQQTHRQQLQVTQPPLPTNNTAPIQQQQGESSQENWGSRPHRASSTSTSNTTRMAVFSPPLSPLHNQQQIQIQHQSHRHHNNNIITQIQTQQQLPQILQDGNATPMIKEQMAIELPEGYYEGPLELKPVINPKDFDASEYSAGGKQARFFVIKSFSEDDVHMSIRHAVWSSTEGGNKRLDRAYREIKKIDANSTIFLFFSVNASGAFCGMAEMASAVDYQKRVPFWQQAERWRGVFFVKWVFIKDIPNNQLRHIRLENNENKPVTNSRDTQEIPETPGLEFLSLFNSFRHRSSILDEFHLAEIRKQHQQRQHRSASSPPAPPPSLESNNINNQQQQQQQQQIGQLSSVLLTSQIQTQQITSTIVSSSSTSSPPSTTLNTSTINAINTNPTSSSKSSRRTHSRHHKHRHGTSKNQQQSSSSIPQQ